LFKAEDLPELRPIRRRQLEAAEDLQNTLADRIRKAVASAEIRADVSPEASARALLALQNGILLQWLQSPRSFSLKECAPALADIYLHGVARR
jgi:hypothetical protein